MANPVTFQPVAPCLWVSAGVLAFRLCDRDFDCEHCPLDAALRGNPQRPALRLPDSKNRDFPADRRYTPGHGWLLELDGCEQSQVRFGLDSFATTLLGCCQRVTFNRRRQPLAQGDLICQIDLGIGELHVASPIGKVWVEGNSSLLDRPNQLVTSPYVEGWIADLTLDRKTDLGPSFAFDRARERSQHDLQRLRRQVALQLLAEDSPQLGPTMADGGEFRADLRQMLGGSRYLELLRELIH